MESNKEFIEFDAFNVRIDGGDVVISNKTDCWELRFREEDAFSSMLKSIIAEEDLKGYLEAWMSIMWVTTHSIPNTDAMSGFVKLFDKMAKDTEVFKTEDTDEEALEDVKRKTAVLDVAKSIDVDKIAPKE